MSLAAITAEIHGRHPEIKQSYSFWLPSALGPHAQVCDCTGLVAGGLSMRVRRMADQALAGKRVMIREDLNVPVEGGVVTSDARIRAALPTIRAALEQGARVILLSHLGRPKEGEFSAENSLAPVATRLGELLGQPVRLQRDWLDGVECAPGEVVLCENVRFNKGEKKDDEGLSRRMAALCDIFEMDAFGTAHRAEASTHGVARFAPIACAGPLLVGELDALERAIALGFRDVKRLRKDPDLAPIRGCARFRTLVERE